MRSDYRAWISQICSVSPWELKALPVTGHWISGEVALNRSETATTGFTTGKSTDVLLTSQVLKWKL